MITEERRKWLAQMWQQHLRDAEKERLAGHDRIADSYENSAARIETELAREDVDPREYL
jgi:hypothetical protein